jgi:hypothetical protein
MNNVNQLKKHGVKRHYFKPEIETIRLDSDISLQLESNPPFPENEYIGSATEYLKNNPFKAQYT